MLKGIKTWLKDMWEQATYRLHRLETRISLLETLGIIFGILTVIGIIGIIIALIIGIPFVTVAALLWLLLWGAAAAGLEVIGFHWGLALAVYIVLILVRMAFHKNK